MASCPTVSAERVAQFGRPCAPSQERRAADERQADRRGVLLPFAAVGGWGRALLGSGVAGLGGAHDHSQQYRHRDDDPCQTDEMMRRCSG